MTDRIEIIKKALGVAKEANTNIVLTTSELQELLNRYDAMRVTLEALVYTPASDKEEIDKAWEMAFQIVGKG